MSDFVSKEKRSKIMSAIRGKGDKTTELALMKLFRKSGITGWRRSKKLPLVNKALRKENWNVVRVWECEMEKRNYNRKLSLIRRYIEDPA